MALRTFGTLKFSVSDKKWRMEKAAPHVCIKLKALFGKIPKWFSPPFIFSNTLEICEDLHWFLQRYPMQMSDSDKDYLEKQRGRRIKDLEELEEIVKPNYKPQVFSLKDGRSLRDYQGQAVEVFLRNKRLLVGDAVGLGKTVVAVGSFTKQETLPALVIVQTHLPDQWQEQIEKFLSVRIHQIKGTKPYSLPPADIYIMKYSCMSGWVDIYQEQIFKSVVFDEIQELRHSTSKRYYAARTLVQNVEYTMGLSATPIYNYADEIFNILDLLKQGCLGTYQDFSREWSAYDRKTVEDPKALGSFLRENFLMLRRTREDVRMELPEVNTIVHQVDFDQKAVERSEKIAIQLATTVMTGSFVERGRAARQLDMMVRHTTGVSKASYVAEYVRILLENKEPVLLVGWHRDVYDIWMQQLVDFNPVLFTGSESQMEKEQSRKMFMTGRTNLMIMSLRSGVGLDGLQERCSIVVFGELDWSPSVHKQVTGRLDRDGQKNRVTSIYLVSESGSDPLMIDLLGLKASQTRSILDPLSGPEQKYTDESRIKQLAQRYLKNTIIPVEDFV